MKKDYDKILNINNNDIYALNNRGILYLNKYKEAKYEEYFNKALENAGVHTETGIFGAMMKVSLINDGPTTIILDSKEII